MEMDELDVASISGNENPGSASPVGLWSLLAVLIVAAISLSAARSIWRYDAPEIAEFDRSRQGQFDFHNGVYFPARAFIDGVSPYGDSFSQQYPVTRPLPLMSPLLLVLHAPLAMLPVRAAECLYFTFNVGLLMVIAWLGVHWLANAQQRITWFLIALLLITASRAGHTTLFTGYLTPLMVVGTLLAVSFSKSNPWLAAMGVALTSCKPTYAIPLFLLLLARGDGRAAWRGLGMSIVCAVVAVGRLLLVATPTQLWADIQHGQSAHMSDSYELPINTWTRIDSLALVAKWAQWAPGEVTHLVVMTLLLPLPALALWRVQFIRDSQYAAGLSSGLIAVSILSTLYHHVYDALLLFPIACGLWLGEPSTLRGTRTIRMIVAALLLMVAWNYPSSELFIKSGGTLSEETRRMITSTGPVALTAAWLGMCALPWLSRQNARHVT
ncbi:MAG: DUF2029 domain-containing protein [Pirellulaceae bacterium]|nr:DUF2029 domain-containing protein [Pirellulaceae bacterium]